MIFYNKKRYASTFYRKGFFVVKNYSKQREEILNFIKESHTHLTAEEIYLALKAMKSTASKGTVYRNLSMFVEEGVLIRIPVENGPDKYDYIHHLHHHAVCKKCGKVYDFKYEINMKELEKNILSQTDIEDVSEYIIVQGICKDCKKELD